MSQEKGQLSSVQAMQDPASKPHFISRVSDVRGLVSDVHLLVDELDGDLQPYSRSQLTAKEGDQGDQGFASDLDQEIYILETEVEDLKDKLQNLIERFNG